MQTYKGLVFAHKNVPVYKANKDSYGFFESLLIIN